MAFLRRLNDLEKCKYNDEKFYTITSEEQLEVERNISKIFNNFHLLNNIDGNLPRLNRREHVRFLERCIHYLPEQYQCLDASRTWICYWILHSLSLLQHQLPGNFLDGIVDFLNKCQHPDGGFGGGPSQTPHIATTYAAINALVIIGTPKAYSIIDREKLRKFLWSLRLPDGSFCMHRDGEVDIRGAYCALSVATLTNVACGKLFEGTAEWIVSCQTYEGGFSGTPGLEAHGGYAFCGLASLFILQKQHLCDVQSLLRWLVNRQMKFEGGFQGRTNKLVDCCYSFWQGGAYPLVHELLCRVDVPPECILIDQVALQEYILICCQHNDGGLIDKPGKPRDIYHTCYALSGLSVAQLDFAKSPVIIGPIHNKVAPTHSVFNIGPFYAMKAMSHFNRLDIPEHI